MYFSVGDYDPESARESILGLSRALEEGETMHVMMVAKARWYQTDEGAIYTSLRPEEVVRIDPSRYSAWLARTANATWPDWPPTNVRSPWSAKGRQR